MGMTKYYVDAEGVYVGGFDGADPPEGSIEVPDAPPHGTCKWDNGWCQPPAYVLNAPILEQLERIDAKSIRALRENDQARITSLEAEAAALRLQLVKD